MVELPKNQVSEMHFDKFPNPSTFQCWKTSFKTEVCSCSNLPMEAVLLIKEVEMVEPVDDLKASQSIEGRRFRIFNMVDAMICVCPEEGHDKTPLREESQSGGA